MCLIAFAIDADPACPLLIAANRDEFFDRPTAPLHRWTLPDGTGVLAGRDLRDGGTWLGVNASGRVAMLTNVRSARPGPGAHSRGELATRWLRGHLDWDGLQAGIDPHAYGGFNLVVGDFHQGHWGWLSNRHPDRPHEDHAEGLHARRLGPGIYGLSNAALDTPWPKTRRLKHAVGDSLARLCSDAASPRWLASLQDALGDSVVAAEHELPPTGVTVEMERALSSPFVCLPDRGYGTRSSLVLRVEPVPADTGPRRWTVGVHEWTHLPDSPAGAQRWNPKGLRSETLAW